MSVSSDVCSRKVLDAVPLVMRAVRTEMRSHRGAGISVPQFRALVFLNRHRGASLSAVAEHLGLTLPSMSRMVDGLVSRNMVTRRTRRDDRRCVTLSLTRSGRAMQEAARAATQSFLAGRLATLSPSERAVVARAMDVIRVLFTSEHEVA